MIPDLIRPAVFLLVLGIGVWVWWNMQKPRPDRSWIVLILGTVLLLGAVAMGAKSCRDNNSQVHSQDRESAWRERE